MVRAPTFIFDKIKHFQDEVFDYLRVFEPFEVYEKSLFNVCIAIWKL